MGRRPSSAARLLASVLLALPPLVAPDIAGAQAVDPARFDPVREHIRRVMAERSLPSVSVAAARDAEVVWEESFGWADREARRPATPHTLYSLASISKPITATGVMRLVEEGVVELDAPVDRYLGAARLRGLAGDADEATVRRVLSHTAGLPLHYQFLYADEPHAPPSRDETIHRYGIVALPPGLDFEYSNLGYGIADHVVTRASGRAYADFMRAEVFRPLGLNRTSIGLTPALEPNAAVRYHTDGARIPYYRFDHDGASAAWASAHDLIRFGLFHLGHAPEGGRAVLEASRRRAMQEPVSLADGSSSGYGLGWFVGDEYGYRKVWHTGSMPGVSTMLALYPEEDVAVVVLLNALDREQRVEIAREVAAVLIPGYADAREEARAEARREAAEESGEDDDEWTPPAELVGTWTGILRTWEGERGVTLEVRSDGDVHVDVEGQLETVLDGPSFREGRLRGRYAGRIPTADAMLHPRHTVALDLLLDGGRLFGQATARSGTDPTHYALTSWMELEREGE